MVSVPVLQPPQQLVSAALLPLLTNHSLQGAWAVLVHPQQSFVPRRPSGDRGLRGRRRGVGGGEAELPAHGLSRTSPGRCPALSGPGGVALTQAGL